MSDGKALLEMHRHMVQRASYNLAAAWASTPRPNEGKTKCRPLPGQHVGLWTYPGPVVKQEDSQ